MLIKFDLSPIPTDATITNANMSLYTFKIAESCCTPGLMMAQGNKYVYNVTKSWVESTVNYGNQPTASTTKTSENTKKAVPAWEDYDVTTAIEAMYSNPSTNYGFLIKCGEAVTYEDFGILMRSSEYSDMTYRPKLTVTYEPGSSIQHPIHGKIIPAKEYKVKVFNLQGKEITSYVIKDIKLLNKTLPVGLNVVKINNQKLKIVKQK